ncbi:hypothetical protein B0I37DRAFT_189601 [Chaetomium sp. MPI-CAGE-AT-0009]|nr:hypothetical protein B0I37DRAFT_189601 [Chaetomium sp. MPI-CAGE-AT-0009]
MCDHNMDPLGDVVLTLRNPNNALLTLCDPQAVFAKPVTFLVSSRHLVLASPVFKAMLTGGWSEGNKSDGRYNICAEGWDAKALAIVMNVLHSHYRQVPRTVSLHMLAKIAVIIDYYKIHEALEVMTTLWMASLKPSMPSHWFLPDDVLWIFVSWVFVDGTAFTQITKTAILWSKKDVGVPEGLPIPPTIIDRINQRRKESLSAIAQGLHDLQQNYREGREGCSFECSAIRLGALTKNLHDLKLLGHPPENPCGDASVTEVAERISTMKSPTWYDLKSVESYRNSGYYSMPATKGHQCPPKAQNGGAKSTKTETLADFSKRLGDSVKSKIEGLRLSDINLDASR